MSESMLLRPFELDQNLLFGLLTLQMDLIDNQQFAEIWATWTAREDRPLTELLVERGWLRLEERKDVERLMSRKLVKHAGDVKAALAELVNNPLHEALSGLAGSGLEKFRTRIGNGAAEYAVISHADRPVAPSFEEGHNPWNDGDAKPWTTPARQWLRNHRRLVQSTASIAVTVLLASALAVLMLTPQNQRPLAARRQLDAEAPHPDFQIEEQMIPVVRALFSTLIRKGDVIDHLRRDGTLTNEERRVALRIAQGFMVNSMNLNNTSWFVVRAPGAAMPAYRRALFLAEEACLMEPRNGSFLNTLGVAQYRVGQYAEAAKTLTESDKINSAGPSGPLPEDIGFLAMAYNRLGDKEKARAMFRRLTRLMNDQSRLMNNRLALLHRQEEQAVLNEADKALRQTER